MTVLRTVISRKQDIDLRARWVLMDKKDDYNALNVIMDSLAHHYNIKLPKNAL